ncbi:hypothetical protein Aab01nite_72380 [Paractinoplanes abujensis]|uniref:Uncharacterized protein n=1 Tax=Paractinoplanes abujensis TaxID=882441 RepID=A0A7W7CUH1_9ACTN|nr:hypothetical protein [Actinoplanes abujensis]MBB4694919.1 hypothetical protein [Actinoplanes abujensis]GID23648.1 hypothetical protein Aab01nite_72380 [Actinoplanes abujensis]
MHRFVAPALAVLLIGACDDAQEPAPPAPQPSIVTSVAEEDPPGAQACAALAQAIEDSSLMTEGVVDAVVRASATADAPVADAAERLRTAYGKAVSSAGTESEPDAVAAVSAAASDMSSVCSDSGLRTVG